MGAFKKLIPSITNNYNTAFARSVVCQTDMDKLRLRATGSGHCFFFRLRWVRFMAANWAMGRIINNKEIALNTSRNNLLATVAYLKIHLENTREYVVQIKMKSHNTTPVYTFQQFNDELNEFYKYLKDNKYTDKEIRHIFTPLRPDTKKIKLTAAVVFSSVILVILLYLLTYNETFSWNLSAIGRIALIKILPYWDWTHLKNEKCLIAKYISPTTLSEISFNCDLCENIQQIDVYNSIAEDILMKRYLDVDTPVIIKKSWQKSDNFMEHISQNPDIANSVPCNLATNVYNGAPSVKKLIEKTHLFEIFFLHFQNCDYFGMKQFRGFAPRPSFLPPELSPVQYNWLLWSKNYNTTHFKPIALVDKVAVVGQIMGANFIKLLPRNNCETECPQINVKLKEGESLIFTSLWNLEYKPSDSDENIAVILELH